MGRVADVAQQQPCPLFRRSRGQPALPLRIGGSRAGERSVIAQTLSGAARTYRASCATIGFLESDRPDGPRAGDAYGDKGITRAGDALRALRHERDRKSTRVARSNWRGAHSAGLDRCSDPRLGLGCAGLRCKRPAVRPVILIGCSSIPSTTQVHAASRRRTIHSSRSARRYRQCFPILNAGAPPPAQVEDSRVAELEQLGDLVRLEDAELRHYVDRGFCGHCKREGRGGGLLVRYCPGDGESRSAYVKTPCDTRARNRSSACSVLRRSRRGGWRRRGRRPHRRATRPGRRRERCAHLLDERHELCQPLGVQPAGSLPTLEPCCDCRPVSLGGSRDLRFAHGDAFS